MQIETYIRRKGANIELTRDSRASTEDGGEGMQIRLSFLWIFAILNYLYADVMSTMDASVLRSLLSGEVGGIQITPGFLLGAAVLMETAILMVPVSRFAPWRTNRLLNIVVGTIHTLAVSASMFVDGPPDAYYILFGTVEISTTIAIVVMAARWSGALHARAVQPG